jgi:hypothetical protein
MGSSMWVSFVRDEKTSLGAHMKAFKRLDNGLKQINNLLGGHLASCLKVIQ